jgi:signal transduction histidine kinase
VISRTELVVAAAAAAWAAAFLVGEGALVAFAPAFGVATLPYRRRPVVAVLAVAAVTLAATLAGVSEENAASLGAGLTVTFSLGRHASGARSYAPILALAAALTVVDGLTIADALFVLFVLSATWACGRLVRRRAERAERAAETAAELAARDPAALAAAVVAEERARLAGDALAVIRAAVEEMRRDAAAADHDLAPGPLQAIQDRGREAVAELRRLLGLLRAEEERPPRTEERTVRRPAAALLVAAALMALALVDVAAWNSGAQPGAIVLTLAFAASVALIPLDAAVACVAAAVPSLLALTFDAPLAYGFSTALAAGVLAWSATADGRPRALAALAFLGLVTLVVTNRQSPGNEGILLGAFALTAIAGHTWGHRDREGSAALARADRLRAEHEAAAERAVRAERLRLARELHDVASHAVGAMMLQAGAALTLRDRDPEAARAAIRTVQASATEALAELSVLFGLLEAGAVGPAGLAARGEGDLDGLAQRMRAGGLDVTITAREPVPEDPVLKATVYRIVQEALTNAARHSPGSHVEVALGVEAGRFVVCVRDDGTGGGGPAAEGGGFGLTGLAERVRALGGDLAAGPAPTGGFTVTARLPA